MKKFIYTAFAICFTLTATAQVSFQRLYEVVQDSTHRLTDGIVTNSGEYATLGQSVFVDTDNEDLENSYRAIFTTYNVKGDLVLQKDIYLADSTTLRSTSDLVQLTDGSFVFTASLLTEDQSAAIVGLDAEGLTKWSKKMGDDYQLKVSLATLPNNHVLVGSMTEDSIIWLAKMNGVDGIDNWSKRYNAVVENNDDVSAFIYEAAVSALDSSLFVTGKSELEDSKGYHLTKLNSSGTVIWSTQTNRDLAGFRFEPYGLTETLDSSIYVVGEMTDDTGLALSFTSKYDNIGNLIWCKTLSGSSSMAVDIIPFGENLVFSNIRTENEVDGITVSSIYEIDSSGTILNTHVYGDSTSLKIPSGSIHNTVDGGIAMFGTHFKAFESQNSDIVKTDENLETPCSIPSNGVLTDLSTVSQSLIWTSVDFSDTDTLETDINNIRYYDVPTISPSVEPWCPNEQIIDTLDATPSPLPDGVITYEWQGPGVEGAMTSSVVGMEEGEYIVMVTINDKHCYTLCDTVNITRLPEPTVNIATDFDQYCEDQTVNLIGSITGVEPFESTIWSTDVTTPSINVNTEGTYSLTVVDACMETATSTVNVVFPDPEQPIIIELELLDCEDYSVRLEAITNADGISGITYSWTGPNNAVIDNADQSEIIVTTPGKYNVEVSYCGESFTETINVPAPELQWPKVFFPRGEEEVNRTFGPYNPCNAAITNYTLKIYNRWGNEVFTSDNINAEWNGQHGGSDSASAVYVWVADYAVGGVQIPEPKKGDVTLLR